MLVLPTMKGVFLVVTVILTFVVAAAKAEPPLNVFIIPHSHCDPGWLNTFEGYFRDQVNRILTGVTDQLITDPKKKFVWAEISFFHLWYDQQPQEVRDQVKTLVKNGQFEFVAGGWVQNDEANANFDIVIDQVSEGHDFLNRVFGVVPRIAWQIDPFGHSSITPSLFARMGFEALVINRIHYGLKSSFKDSKSMEFLWTGSRSLGNASELFTHVLHTHYSAPQGFDWEESSMHVTPQNVNMRANDLVHLLRSRANSYRTNNLLVPFGDDFKFQNAGTQFHNMDQLITEINSRRDFGVTIKYATVSDYFDAVKDSSRNENIKFPTYGGDFFPYADNEDSYWTGYYTTRPGLKGHSRGTDSIIRAAEGVYALGRTEASFNEKLNTDVDWNAHFEGLRQARRNAALVQHHDGITGTAKQFVANDYSSRLDQARSASARTITEMVQILLTDKETPALTYDFKSFSFDNGDEVYCLAVHNPLGWVRRKYIKVTVTISQVAVTSHDGVVLAAQVMPVIDVTTLQPAVSLYEVYFLAEVPPMGVKTFFLSRSKSIGSNPLPSEHFTYSKNFAGLPSSLSKAEIQIENEHLSVKFQTQTGLIASVHNKDKGSEVTINQEIIDYLTSRSGAYIMRPDQQVSVYSDRTPIKVVHVKGILVSLVCTYFFPSTANNNFETSVCVRVYSTRGLTAHSSILEVGGFLEVAYNVIGRRNCETVVRYTTDLASDRTFYTDNGLEIRERKTKGTRTENQYYPNLSLAYLQDAGKDLQFTILSQQAMGTHSRENGMLEQMVHRALAQDDGRGLNEPNNDNSRIEVVVYLLVQPIDPSVRIARRLALALQHQPRVLHTSTSGGAKEWSLKHKSHYSPFAEQLPHNVHLLSLKARDSITDDLIFRLVHIYEAGQHDVHSKSREIEWNRIFKDFNFESKRERSLALSLDVVTASKRKPLYLSSGTALDHASGGAPTFVKGESQNTDEEGVFISQAALDDKNKAGEEKSPNPTARKLNAVALSPEEVILLEPMQIKSYFVQLIPKSFVAPTIKPRPKPGLGEDGKGKGPTSIPDNEPDDDMQVSDGERWPTRIWRTVNMLILTNQMRAFFIISIVGTGLVILAYVRLRKRNNKSIAKRKGLLEV